MLIEMPFANYVGTSIVAGFIVTALLAGLLVALYALVEGVSSWVTRGRRTVRLQWIVSIGRAGPVAPLLSWFLVSWTLVAFEVPFLFWLYPLVGFLLCFAYLTRFTFDIYFKVKK